MGRDNYFFAHIGGNHGAAPARPQGRAGLGASDHAREAAGGLAASRTTPAAAGTRAAHESTALLRTLSAAPFTVAAMTAFLPLAVALAV